MGNSPVDPVASTLGAAPLWHQTDNFANVSDGINIGCSPTLAKPPDTLLLLIMIISRRENKSAN